MPRARRERATGGGDPAASLADEALLAGVSAGSEAHFNALYARYFARVYAFASARAGNRADAEELAQEIFTAVFRSAARFSRRAPPLAWIYGIARNTLLNFQLRRRLQRAREAQLARRALGPPPPDWAFTPEEQYRQRRVGEELERRLRKLAPWQLDVFWLRHLEDLPIEEIARRTMRSIEAVRSGLYRAKRVLFETADLGERGE
jgi:RNA polymerase sigma-70 factor (ECF subfamily)